MKFHWHIVLAILLFTTCGIFTVLMRVKSLRDRSHEPHSLQYTKYLFKQLSLWKPRGSCFTVTSVMELSPSWQEWSSKERYVFSLATRLFKQWSPRNWIFPGISCWDKEKCWCQQEEKFAPWEDISHSCDKLLHHFAVETGARIMISQWWAGLLGHMHFCFLFQLKPPVRFLEVGVTGPLYLSLFLPGPIELISFLFCTDIQCFNYPVEYKWSSQDC